MTCQLFIGVDEWSMDSWIQTLRDLSSCDKFGACVGGLADFCQSGTNILTKTMCNSDWKSGLLTISPRYPVELSKDCMVLVLDLLFIGRHRKGFRRWWLLCVGLNAVVTCGGITCGSIWTVVLIGRHQQCNSDWSKCLLQRCYRS